MKKLLLATLLATCFLTQTIISTSWAGDNGDGTITINSLVWLKDAGCLGPATWDMSQNTVASLSSGQCGLNDKSTPGQWRLPTIAELQTAYTYKSSFTSVRSVPYWSSSTLPNAPQRAQVLNMSYGSPINADKGRLLYILPVRANNAR